MKKVFPLLTLAFLFACSSDDNVSDAVSDSDLVIIATHSENMTTKSENGKYENMFSAVITNAGKHDVSGYVKFTIKDHGIINSDRGIVPSAKGTQQSYFIKVETDEVIDRSYLLKTEFVRD